MRFGANFNENDKVTTIFDRVIPGTNFIDVFIPELGDIKAQIGIHGAIDGDGKIVTVNSGDPLWWQFEILALKGATNIANRSTHWWIEKYHEILSSRFRLVLKELKVSNL